MNDITSPGAISKKRPRYEEVLQEQAEARTRVFDRGELTTEDYFEMEFQMGCKLVDIFFSGIKDPARTEYTRQLLELEKIGFWAWFKQRRAQMETHWLRKFEFNHVLDVKVYSSGISPSEFRRHWRDAHIHWICSEQTERQLYAFLKQSNHFKI